MNPEAFVAVARTLKGAKWRHLGREPHAVDCVGLLTLSFNGCGMTFKDERLYGREPVGDLLRQGAIKRWGMPIPKDQARAGAIALLRWGKAPPSHTGILANHPDGGLSMIHAHLLHGVVEQRFDGLVVAAVTDIFWPWGDLK